MGSEVFYLQSVIHKGISHDKAFSETHALRMIFCIFIQKSDEFNGHFYRFMQKQLLVNRHGGLEIDSFSSGPFHKNIVSVPGKHEHRLSTTLGKLFRQLFFSLKDTCRKMRKNSPSHRLSTEYIEIQALRIILLRHPAPSVSKTEV